MSVRKSFHANIRKSDLPMVNLGGVWRKNSILHYKVITSNYLKYACFPQKVRYVTTFYKRWPELLHTCSNVCPSRHLTYGGYFLFSPKISGRRQKLDPTLGPSNYKHLPKIPMFSAENSLYPRRFIRDGPELLHTCSTCMSIPRPYLRGVLFIFAEYIWSKKSAES